jgi:hypothetical protein
VLWQRYPGIVHIDATFKVNRFNVPLLSIVGTTGLNTTFYIANIFLAGKTTSDYTWAMKLLRKLAETCGIMPDVIFIDKEDALANAIALVFLETRQFYCIFHINGCILHKVRKVYLEEKDQDSFFNDWRQVVWAKTEEQFNKKWKLLMKDSIRKKLKRYLETEWLIVKEQFCHAWTDNCLHFGQRSTSRVEGSHNALKRRLKVSTGDLKHVVDSLELMIKKQVSEHLYKLNALKIRRVRAHQIMLFEWAVEFVNPQALSKVLEHWEKLKKGELSRECDGTFEKTMGLPCAHTCERQQVRGKPLLLSKFDKRWRYKQQVEEGEDIDIPYELIRNPAVIPRRKGRGPARQAV